MKRAPDFTELGKGKGQEVVYGFYLPTYRGGDQDRFPIKIGSTTGPVSARLARLSTALPEKALVVVLIWTDDALSLERTIQAVLRYRGWWHSTGGGNEWYMTHPVEIEYIYEWLEDWSDITDVIFYS